MRVDTRGVTSVSRRRASRKTSLESRYSHARIASTLYVALRVETDATTRRASDDERETNDF